MYDTPASNLLFRLLLRINASSKLCKGNSTGTTKKRGISKRQGAEEKSKSLGQHCVIRVLQSGSVFENCETDDQILHGAIEMIMSVV